MSLDDDEPSFVLPRLPGTGIAAAIGLLLMLLLAVAMFMSWRQGTLSERMSEPVGFPGAAASGDWLPADRVVGRVFVSGVDGAPLSETEIEDLMIEVGAVPLPGVGWRWPQASGEMAMVVVEGGQVEAAPISEHGFEDLRDAVEVMGWTLRVEGPGER